MTLPLGNKTFKNIKHLGARPKDDQDNVYREKLCNYVRDKGCFYELCPEKFYMVYMAKGEDLDHLLKAAESDTNCPFIFWTKRDAPTLNYESFCMDFGPYNLAVTHQFCSRVKIWAETLAYRHPDKIPVIALDDFDTEKKLNTTLLVAIASMVIFKLTDQEVLQRLNFFMMYKGKAGEASKQLVFREKKKFSDVSGNQSLMTLTLDDCIKAFYAALQLKFYDYHQFDPTEYLFYETVMSGDLNWIVPGKILAFAGPSDSGGWNKRPPSFYYHYFKDHNVSSIIRLNDPEYDANDFRQLGFEHHDLIFPDGYPPTSPIAAKFIKIIDEAKGAVAVHCYAGIGRTGTLIAAYLMARYDFTPQMAVAWTRICRPGSVIGEQQDWLYTKFDNYSFSKSYNQTPKPLKNRKIKAVSTPEPPTELVETSNDVKTCPPTPVTRQQSKSAYAVAEKTLGQAKALQLTKSQRENSDRPCTRSHPAPLKRNSIDTNTSGSATSIKDHQVGEATNNLASKKDVLLDLGKTVPFALELDDLLPLKGKSNPTHYRFKDGKYEFKIKFPPAGYVDLRHSFQRDELLLEARKLESAYVSGEPVLDFEYVETPEEREKRRIREEVEFDDGTGPLVPERVQRLKPVSHYSLLGQ